MRRRPYKPGLKPPTLDSFPPRGPIHHNVVHLNEPNPPRKPTNSGKD